MIRNELILDLNSELILDNFAGGGGASSGIEEALGRHVDHAINHDPLALGMHRINHPQTIHHCEDIFDIDPYKLTGAVLPNKPGRPVGFAWFSPDCKHFSKAKGGKPLDKKIRGLALIMLRYAATIRPRVMVMENVEEIEDWGPLHEDHDNGCSGGKECKKGCHFQRPIAEHKGRTWKAFKSALSSGLDPSHPDMPEILDVLNDNIPLNSPVRVGPDQLIRGFGYHCETKELRACDYGAPTIRKRLFMICRCDGLPVVWPEPTHADPKMLNGPMKLQPPQNRPARLVPWRVIAECIDWHIPCPSIFLTPTQAVKAKCRRPLKHNTLRRIAAGVDRYVLKAEKPFIISVTHQGSDRIESIDEPAKTLTAAHRGEKALVAPVIGRCAHGEPRGQGAHPVTEPMGTQAASKDFSLIQTQLAPFVSDANRPQEARNAPADEPMRTQCAEVKRGHLQIVSGTVVGCGGRAAQSRPRGMDEPHHTNTAKADACLVTGTVVGAGGPARSGEPRPLTKPMHTLLVKSDSHLVAGTMIQTGYGEREGQAPRVPGVEKPLGTVVAGGGKHAVIAANMIVNTTGHSGGSADAPNKTIAAGGQHHALVAAHLTKFTTGSDGRPVTEPSPTVVAGSHSPETHGGAASTLGLVAANMVKLRGTNLGSPADAPVHTLSAGGQHHGLVESKLAYIAQHNAGFNTNPGHPADEPSSTISAKGSQQQIVAASAVAYYGSETDGQPMTEPMRTATVKPRLAVSTAHGIERPAPPLIHLLTDEHIAGARRVAAFLRSYGVQFEGEFATVGEYIIVDLGMRMLTSRELFRAQGFQPAYVIDRAWLVHPTTGEIREEKLTKEAQIRMCGNSVSPPCARAITAANVPELAGWKNGEHKRFARAHNIPVLQSQ